MNNLFKQKFYSLKCKNYKKTFLYITSGIFLE